GIGNGISLLIMAGIVSRLPFAINQLRQMVNLSLTGGDGELGILHVLFLIGAFLFVVAGAILITQGQRRIPIQQAKQVRGRRIYGGQRHYMPLRVNHGGVMPIIFASSLLIFPNMLFGWLRDRFPGSDWALTLYEAFQSGSYMHSMVYIAMIFFFAYFWTTVNFRPKDMAEQLRDYGHFIPGLRPGKRTADYLERVMERITYCGAAFLALIAVIPTAIASMLHIPFGISAFLGGTGLLIVVSVALDLVQRIESNLVMRNYGGFLGGSTRIKGAYR
ncbi:MAG: preprotein translocase subunit SecY, partial [Phycisphaerae bacterium]|nr:preprotein translocase subunit SecY [Phycisphaerae bacterium]